MRHYCLGEILTLSIVSEESTKSRIQNELVTNSSKDDEEAYTQAGQIFVFRLSIVSDNSTSSIIIGSQQNLQASMETKDVMKGHQR
jgi:hypothetical protein